MFTTSILPHVEIQAKARDCVHFYMWQCNVRKKPSELKEELPNGKCVLQKHSTKCCSLATDLGGNTSRFPSEQ